MRYIYLCTFFVYQRVNNALDIFIVNSKKGYMGQPKKILNHKIPLTGRQVDIIRDLQTKFYNCPQKVS